MTGDDLRAFRTTHQLSQHELARLLAVHRPTISDWERGSQGIEHPEILRLALVGLEAEWTAGTRDPPYRRQRRIFPEDGRTQRAGRAAVPETP